MTTQTKLAALGVVVVLAVVGSVLYVMSARSAQPTVPDAAAAPVSAEDLGRLESGSRIVFRSTAVGDTYGRVAVVALASPAGPRAFTPATCDRVYARPDRAVCLYAKPGLVTTYSARVLGADWSSTRDLPLAGVPSRTRISPDGSMVATTTFVSGHGYASPGQFSTQTLVTDLGTGQTTDIESLDLTGRDGRPVTARDRNLWGVTFVDSDRFYATAAFGGATWLVLGSLSTKRMVVQREDAECPSLSPDGTRIAFKTRVGQAPGHWRIGVYTIAADQTTILAEQRSVDDQIEWLDDNQVIYGLPRAGEGPSGSDVWVAPSDGSGVPQLLVPDAWSPAVIR